MTLLKRIEELEMITESQAQDFYYVARTAIPELCAALREAIEILNNAASHECGLDGHVFPFAEDSRAFLDNHGLKEEK